MGTKATKPATATNAARAATAAKAATAASAAKAAGKAAGRAVRAEYGLVGGNIFHGELSLEQLFHMRPAPGFADYRTPVPGLYYASSATHAGGGVCGIPGMQAAKAALADQRAARRAVRRRP